MRPDLASSEGYESKIGWFVTYKDGTTISSEEITSEEIDRPNLHKFMLVDLKDGRALVTQRFSPGQKLIYRARTAMRNQGVLDRIHILGWEKDDTRHVAFVFESDMSVEMGDFIDPNTEHSEDSPWFYPIERHDYDEVEVA